jgi:RimJ/RimL family protein N-acetyltransferase
MQHFAGTLSRSESDQLLAGIEAHFARHGFGLFAAELRETGQFVGFIGISIPEFDAPFMPAVEIGWRLDPACWNRGLATEGARAVLRYAFDILELKEVVSFTVPDNLASRRVMEKLGMTREAADDFDYPRLPAGHPLRRHVLYRLSNI